MSDRPFKPRLTNAHRNLLLLVWQRTGGRTEPVPVKGFDMAMLKVIADEDLATLSPDNVTLTEAGARIAKRFSQQLTVRHRPLHSDNELPQPKEVQRSVKQADTIYEKAVQILYYRAQVLPVHLIRLQNVFADDKIRIEALFPYPYAHREPLDNLSIWLPIPRGGENPVTPFEMPRTGADDTVVFIYVKDRGRIYYRPGRWEKYLNTLIEEIDRKLGATEQLNNTEIDDENLFPDL